VAEPIFTAPSAWLGGFYTLANELADRSDEHSRSGDERLIVLSTACGLVSANDINQFNGLLLGM
jgi:hypothetical protein